MAFFVYMLASRRNGTPYVGMTDHLVRRVYEHKEKQRQGFTAKYGVDRLVWFEVWEGREGAFVRERRIKKWNRAWKLKLVEAENPEWEDLFGRVLATWM